MMRYRIADIIVCAWYCATEKKRLWGECGGNYEEEAYRIIQAAHDKALREYNWFYANSISGSEFVGLVPSESR